MSLTHPTTQEIIASALHDARLVIADKPLAWRRAAIVGAVLSLYGDSLTGADSHEMVERMSKRVWPEEREERR